MRDVIRWSRRLLAIGAVGLLLGLAISVLTGQTSLAEQLGTASYEMFIALAGVIAIDCWLTRIDS